jgi:hypothetical protein
MTMRVVFLLLGFGITLTAIGWGYSLGMAEGLLACTATSHARHIAVVFR